MSKYINLIDKLSDNDKKTLTSYISKFGCAIKDFIGLDTWLENWSHANQQLYKLLGNEFIKTYDLEYEKPKHIFEDEILYLLASNNFQFEFIHDFITFLSEKDYLTEEDCNAFGALVKDQNFFNGQTYIKIKIKKPNAKTTLQIQSGTKIFKALNKVIKYYSDEFSFNMAAFEELQKKYAILMTQKKIKTKFCVSIHPMDYLTMSDNNSNWQSCMNWKHAGCYRVGTIEMMNSNNVLCCYLLNPSSNTFVFDEKITDEETGEILGTWNNKSWRQLFYITKDIIMGGKAYPYVSKDITFIILDQIKALAAENLNWHYSFGPELYQDMVHVNGRIAMNNQHIWMKQEKKDPFKHNIIFETNGMYNDMLEDSKTDYWCYRNKVQHTKIISVSGKAKCLCCNEDIISYNENSDYDDYSDRYRNTGSVVCEDCLDEKYSCAICGNQESTMQHYNLVDDKKICTSCIEDIKICPHCGKPFILNNLDNDFSSIYYNDIIFNEMYEHPEWFQVNEKQTIPSKETLSYDLVEKEEEEKMPYKTETRWHLPLYHIYACKQCVRNIFIEEQLQKYSIRIPIKNYTIWVGVGKTDIYIINPEIGKKYLASQLQQGTLKEFIEEYKKEQEQKRELILSFN